MCVLDIESHVTEIVPTMVQAFDTNHIGSEQSGKDVQSDSLSLANSFKTIKSHQKNQLRFTKHRR